jgi:hypothetical protein
MHGTYNIKLPFSMFNNYVPLQWCILIKVKLIYSQSDKMYNSVTLIMQLHCPTCFEPLIWVHLQGLITHYSHQVVQLYQFMLIINVIELYILSDCEYKVKMYGMNNIKFLKLTCRLLAVRDSIRETRSVIQIPKKNNSTVRLRDRI